MITTFPSKVYYLDEDTDHDTHDDLCCCDSFSPIPHKAIGASLYLLDLEGARAWHALRIGTDVDGFADWCRWQESQGTYYGINSEAAIAAAIAQTGRSGWRIINRRDCVLAFRIVSRLVIRIARHAQYGPGKGRSRFCQFNFHSQ